MLLKDLDNRTRGIAPTPAIRRNEKMLFWYLEEKAWENISPHAASVEFWFFNVNELVRCGNLLFFFRSCRNVSLSVWVPPRRDSRWSALESRWLFYLINQCRLKQLKTELPPSLCRSRDLSFLALTSFLRIKVKWIQNDVIRWKIRWNMKV